MKSTLQGSFSHPALWDTTAELTKAVGGEIVSHYEQHDLTLGSLPGLALT
jgi:hypothetical protein